MLHFETISNRFPFFRFKKWTYDENEHILDPFWQIYWEIGKNAWKMLHFETMPNWFPFFRFKKWTYDEMNWNKMINSLHIDYQRVIVRRYQLQKYFANWGTSKQQHWWILIAFWSCWYTWDFSSLPPGDGGMEDDNFFLLFFLQAKVKRKDGKWLLVRFFLKLSKRTFELGWIVSVCLRGTVCKKKLILEKFN